MVSTEVAASKLVFEKSHGSSHLTPQDVALALLARIHHSARDVWLVGRRVPEQEGVAYVESVCALG